LAKMHSSGVEAERARARSAAPARVGVGGEGGAAPLLVHVTGFRTKLIAQTNPLASASNRLTVTLAPDCNMAVGSNVTVRGLTGSETADGELGLNVSAFGESSGVLGPSGWWSGGSGELTVRVVGPGLVNGSLYGVSFVLQNNASKQASPAISVRASVKSDTGPDDGQGEYQAMDKPGTAAVGVTGGADPLLVHVPSFSVKAIGQTNPLSSASNKLTVTLVALMIRQTVLRFQPSEELNK
jgi:hypothetical protein